VSTDVREQVRQWGCCIVEHPEALPAAAGSIAAAAMNAAR
jgi:hypothetical protein